MKKALKNIFLLTLALTLFTSSFSSIAKAQKTNNREKKEVVEMAKQLQFVFEKAAIKNKNGDLIGLDINMIEENYGSSPELKELKQEMATNLNTGNGRMVSTMDAKVDACINKKIKNGIGEFLSVSAITSVITYIVDKQYTLAAAKLIKLGVKGNAVSIAAQLAYYMMKCKYEVHGIWG